MPLNISKLDSRTIIGLEILAKMINPTEYADIVVSSSSFERMTNAK